MLSLCEIDTRSIDEIWNHSTTLGPCLKTLNFGCKSLDLTLGGVLAGEIVEFYGDSACGKTQVSLSIIANTLIEDYLANLEGRNVILIYTHSTPPLYRIKHIISSRLNLLLPSANLDPVVNKLLKRLLISTPRDYRELYKLLTEDIFAITISDQIGAVPNLLVIDSISLMRRIEHKESVRRHVALIRSVSRHLKKFAHQRGAAIVVTNQAQTSSKIDGFAIKPPVLGSYWTRSINTRVYLHQYRMHNYDLGISENSKRVAKLIYSSKPLPMQ